MVEEWMVEEWIYEGTLKLKTYARAVLNLSRIGNIVGANHYKKKIAEQRRYLKAIRSIE